jgi:putative flippase GtrA
VGGMNTVLSFLIYNLLILINVQYIVAYLIAFVLTWINAFYWNGKHVFKSATRQAMVRYFTLYVGTTLLGIGLLYLLVDVLLINKTLAQLPVIPVTTILNFTGSKFWAFKNNRQQVI